MATIPSTGARRAKAALLALFTVAAGAAAQQFYGGSGTELWGLQLAGVVFASVMLDAPARDSRALARGLLGAVTGLTAYQLGLLLVFGKTSAHTLLGVLVVTTVVVVLHTVITLGAWGISRRRGPGLPTPAA